MSVGTPVSLTSGTDTTTRNAYTTASVSPTSGRLVVIEIQNSVASGSVNTPTVSGCGLTWTNQVSWGYNTLSSSDRRLTTFTAPAISPSAGVITIDFAGQDQSSCSWSVFEVPGAYMSNPIRQATGNATDSTVTTFTPPLATMRAGSMWVQIVGLNNGQTLTPKGTGVQIHQVTGSSPAMALNTAYGYDSDTANRGATWPSVTRAAGLAIEIVEIPSPATYMTIGEFDDHQFKVELGISDETNLTTRMRVTNNHPTKQYTVRLDDGTVSFNQHFEEDSGVTEYIFDADPGLGFTSMLNPDNNAFAVEMFESPT